MKLPRNLWQTFTSQQLLRASRSVSQNVRDSGIRCSGILDYTGHGGDVQFSPIDGKRGKELGKCSANDLEPLETTSASSVYRSVVGRHETERTSSS